MPTNQTADEQVWKQRFQDTVLLCASLYWQNDRDEFFRTIAEHLGDMTGADVVNIRLLSSAQDSFVTYVTHGGLDPKLVEDYSVLSSTEGRMPELMSTLQPIVFDFANPHANDVELNKGVSEGFEVAITIPLVNWVKVEGVFDLLYREKPQIDDEWLEWLADLGCLIGVIVSNSLLMDQQISERLIDERKRLSSEIHDYISQSVNVISFEAGNMQESLREGDMDLLKNQLARLSKASDEAVKTLRGELSQLQEGSSEKGVGFEDIESYLSNFSKRWGLQTSVEIDAEHDDVRLSPRVSAQFMRILNEAMNNVVRHSGTNIVQVFIKESAYSLSVQVSDQGCGFDADSVEPERLGLRTMRERAQSVAGDVLVSSQPGRGTEVSIFIPHLV